MSIGIEEDHVELARVANELLEERGGTTWARLALDGECSLPGYWDEIVKLGWLGLHVPEELGGSGFGLLEAAITAEALGRVCAPGPFLPVVAAAAAIADAATEEQRARLVPPLVSGSLVAGVTTSASGALTKGHFDIVDVTVLGGDRAELFVAAVGDDLVLVNRDAPGVCVTTPAGVDAGLGFARAHVLVGRRGR